MNPSLEELQHLVDVAMQRRPGTVLFKNAKVINVFTLEVESTHVLLAGRWIAALGSFLEDASAEEVIDLQGSYLAPGLIDAHLHIESSLVVPAEYARAVVPRGVTGIVADPHEVANVAGVEAIEWMLRASENLPLEVWFTVSSSVPSTEHETSGARLDLKTIESLLQHPRIVGVAELMSVSRFLKAESEELLKVCLAEKVGKRADGHAPGVVQRELQAYLASGVASDHESTTLIEGHEKLAAGCFLMIREGSATRNLEAQIALVDSRYGDRVGFVTDDRLPQDLISEGGVDFLVRKAIALGADPLYAIRAASYNNANYFKLQRRGAIAPGYQADLVILDDLPSFKAREVYQQGRCVAKNGQVTVAIPHTEVSQAVLGSTKLPKLTTNDLRLAHTSDRVRIIQAIPNQILTKEVIFEPTVKNAEVVSDPSRDLLKLVCVERHGHHGKCGVGLVQGFGLQRGAIAGTIAHDHHNCMAVGATDRDMLAAIDRIGQMGGGMVAVEDGRVIAELALPLAGLLSDLPLEEICIAMDRLNKAVEGLGCCFPAPFMGLSFLGLAVIPDLRLTDLGLVDVVKNTLVPFAVA
jgi:adenine deaminase